MIEKVCSECGVAGSSCQQNSDGVFCLDWIACRERCYLRDNSVFLTSVDQVDDARNTGYISALTAQHVAYALGQKNSADKMTADEKFMVQRNPAEIVAAFTWLLSRVAHQAGHDVKCARCLPFYKVNIVPDYRCGMHYAEDFLADYKPQKA